MEKLTYDTRPGEALDNINEHNHTEGVGAKIPGEGLADGAVTADKIAAGAVERSKIADKAVGKGQLDDTVTSALIQNAAALAGSPMFYQRDLPFYFYDKTTIASPSRLWVNIGDAGYILTEQEKINIDLDTSWDSNAVLWQSEHDYKKDDVVFANASKDGYLYRCITAGRSSTLQPDFPKEVGKTYNDGNVIWIAEKDYTVGGNRAGLDVCIYACKPDSGTVPKLLLSAKKDVPIGHTKENSRKIGGFHCECMNVGEPTPEHWLKGWSTGDILPFSVWDVEHRPVDSSPDGMVWIPKYGWISIYFLSVEEIDGVKTLYSRYNAKISTMNDIVDIDMIKLGHRFPSQDIVFRAVTGAEFAKVIKGATNPVTAGGHENTASHRIVSNFGLEDCVGCLYISTANARESVRVSVIGYAKDTESAIVQHRGSYTNVASKDANIGYLSFAESMNNAPEELLPLILERMKAARDAS